MTLTGKNSKSNLNLRTPLENIVGFHQMGEELVTDQGKAQEVKYLRDKRITLWICQYPAQHCAEQLDLVP
jgi:hypothetical protein